MDKFEKLVLEIMAETEKDGEPVTRAEAEEMAEMELGAKANFKHEATATKPRAERKPKERKVDEEKLTILNWVERGLYEMGGIHSTKENEVKLHFNYNGNEYTLNLVKHRPPKK